MKKALFTAICLFIGLSMATAQITLSFNPEKGATYQFSMEILQKIKQNVMGQELPMNMNLSTTYTMSIVEKNNDGVKASFLYKDLYYEMSSAMMNMKYDSKNPTANANAMDAIMAKIFGAMIDKKFEAVIALDGTVKSVTGMDAILEDMSKAVGSDMQAAQIAESLKQQYSNDAMKASLEQSFKIYPTGKIKPGDSWTVNQKNDAAGMAMNTTSTYTLKSTDKKSALVDVTSVIDGMDGKLTGTQSGTLKYDVKTGLVDESNIKQNISGTVTTQGMDIGMELDSDMKVSVKKEK